ncbi:MAG: HAD hydrolase-like protein, partial [Micropruina sp.]
VYVGDAVVDLQAARAAGLAAIAVTWGAGTAEELASENPELVVTSIADLRSALLP